MAYNMFNSNLSGLFSNTNGGGLSSLLGEYASIRSGNYKKLLTAYYAKVDSSDSSSATASKKKTYNYRDNVAMLGNHAAEGDETIKAAKKESKELVSSIEDLTKTGKGSLFEKKEFEVTNEETGEVTKTEDYDMDAITKAITSFVDSYNKAITAGYDASDANVQQKTALMAKATDSYEKMLEKVGITIGKDNKLTLDVEKLKKANMSDIKSVFNGRDSIAAKIKDKAEQISKAADSAASAASTYNASGSSNYDNYFRGSYFEKYF